MSVLKVNNITNRAGIAGPTVAGVASVSSSSHFVVPTGRTVGRYIEENTLVTDGLLFYVDAGRTESWDQRNALGFSTSYWRDLSGNDYHVPNINPPTYDSANGGSLSFDGVNDRFEIVSQPGPLNPDYVSFECWFKYSSSGTQGDSFIGGRGDTGFNGYWLGTDNNDTSSPRIIFSVATSSTQFARANFSYTKGTIYHAVGTWDGYGSKLYVNGLFAANASSGTGFAQMTGPIRYASMSNGFVIGNNDNLTGTRFWTGNIYEMRIYNRALSAAEVLQNFNATKSRYGY